MRSIWTRAAVGALVIFALGMLLLKGLRSTRDGLSSLAYDVKPQVEAQLAEAFSHIDRPIPFILDGTTMGQLLNVRMQRPKHGGPLTVRAVVMLDNPASASRFAGCDLVPSNPDAVDLKDGFRCSSPGETGLQSIGEVRLEPVGMTRPIRASKAALSELQKQASVTVDSEHGVITNVIGDSGEIVNITADSNGAVIHVKDKKGKTVNVSADKSWRVGEGGLHHLAVSPSSVPGARGTGGGRRHVGGTRRHVGAGRITRNRLVRARAPGIVSDPPDSILVPNHHQLLSSQCLIVVLHRELKPHELGVLIGWPVRRVLHRQYLATYHAVRSPGGWRECCEPGGRRVLPEHDGKLGPRFGGPAGIHQAQPWLRHGRGGLNGAVHGTHLVGCDQLCVEWCCHCGQTDQGP